MQKDYLRKAFDSLCRVFRQGKVAVLDQKGRVLHAYPGKDALPEWGLGGEVEYFPKEQVARLRYPVLEHWAAHVEMPCGGGEEAESLHRIGQSVIGLVQRQEKLHNKVSLSRDNMAFLVSRLFNATSPESVAYVAMWGIDLGFDLTLPRAVCVFEIMMNEANAVLKESICRSVLHTVKTFPGFSGQDIAAQLNNNQLVLCKKVDSREGPLRRQVYPYLSELCSFLMNRYHISVNVGVGCPPPGIPSYSASLREAQTALRYSRIFSGNQAISFFDDYTLETEVARVPQEVLGHFLGEKLQRLRASSQMLETVEALVQNNMDIGATAEQLFIHRNTAVFRVNQIKKVLGLNPLHNDSDRFTLMALYIYHKLTER